MLLHPLYFHALKEKSNLFDRAIRDRTIRLPWESFKFHAICDRTIVTTRSGRLQRTDCDLQKNFPYVPNDRKSAILFYGSKRVRPHRGSRATARDAVRRRRSLDVGRRVDGDVSRITITHFAIAIKSRRRGVASRRVARRSRGSMRFFQIIDIVDAREATARIRACGRSICQFLGVCPAIWYADAALAVFLVV